MAKFKTGINRNQLVLIPTYLNDLIDEDNDIRVIDAFVDSLDMHKLNFKFSSPNIKGNRPYDPKDMLKLYLLGYKQGIRSSRKLMYQAKNNIEYIWLLKAVSPDFRSISDFRKDNCDSLKNVLIQFNLSCKDLNILSNTFSQDGTKLKAVNSKDNNFTFSKLDDRKKRIQEHIDEYMELLDVSDDIDSKESRLSEIQKLKDKLHTLESYEKDMLDNHSSQKSLIDPESKLMRDNGKFTVGFNNQVCVDLNSHIVTDFKITDSPADLGSITDISSEIKDIYSFDTVTNITDKGYIDRKDMMNSLENGIIPEVTPQTGKDGFDLVTVYEENVITDDMIKSSNPSVIKKCLRAGVIPDVYKDKISSIEVKDVTTYEEENIEDVSSLSEDELRDKAMNDNCFTRHIDSNKVFCPMGEVLRQKSSNSKGIRYYNKLACKNCKNPCCDCPFKVVEFRSNNTIILKKDSNTNKSKPKKKKKRTKKIVKKVFIRLNSNFELLKKRMSISEHPHASMKFWDHSNYLLLKGIRKATGEVALYYCAFNIRRAINILGVKKI
ncbi:MAG: transposase, partial [Bacilli bacterium]